MAHDPSRTEKATGKRRQKAREEGSVPRSADFDSVVLLWGNFLLFMAMGTATVALLAQQFAHFLSTARPGGLEDGTRTVLLWEVGRVLLRVLGPFLGINLLIALASGFMQRGFNPSAKPLIPKFERLNPTTGFQRLFSARSFVELLKSLLKFTLLAAVAWQALGPRLPALLSTSRMGLETAMALLTSTLFVLYRNCLLAMLALALADFAYQRHAWEKSIRMTKQEVKEEMKDADGNPEVKRQQRNLMAAAARRRMMAAVPKASVVVTNPTHVAVALKYDEKTAAPVCVAKGLDHLALKIRERAKESGVIVLERPELARALYRAVEVDKPIPKDLYQAVAQVLAFVYRLRGAA
jgi:flagellar biosynthetic protein FlhB